MEQPLFVPVRVTAAGTHAVHTARTRDDRRRVGLAFTTADRLHAALGADRRWTRLSWPALRALLRPLGIGEVVLDPLYVGPDLPDAGPVLAGVRQTQWVPDEVW
ncbi:hypothetical protein SRB5_01720 [Streptomyces sp. RB5]|uniref:SseB protein N-terminal domain-containing protein n=1 Tax=Streptomyces smaragdinus TaxID=2585196 RepID=A0A7K0C9H2_9ACTN|nr:SAV_915 family protein [Streptomyces smaragdinus]MQY10068.1 hypothetical protein [Streptomyces smaragdinus]